MLAGKGLIEIYTTYLCTCWYIINIYTDDVKIFGGDLHTVNKNAEGLLICSKEIGLEINAEKSKYMYGHAMRSKCRTVLQHKVR